MKIAIIADTHWGVRGDRVAFLDNNKKFLDDVFFPTLEERGIRNIIHLGDLVDKRASININTAARLYEDFLEPVSDRGLNMYVIAGNHDVYHKTTNRINSLDQLLSRYRNDIRIEWWSEATEFHIGGHLLMFIPWINDENRQQTEARIAASKAKYCFGHLELAGYQMYKGVVNEHGEDRSLYRQFDHVFTGHYHHKSSDGNIHYVGSHGQFTWSDYNDPRGFHIFDLDNQTIEFIGNPYDMFVKVGYHDADEGNVVWNMATNESLKPSDVTGKYVKVVIRTKTNPASFELLIEKLQELKPLDIQILDEAFNIDVEDQAIILETQDTLTIIKNHVDSLADDDAPKADLTRLFVKLYQQASEITQ